MCCAPKIYCIYTIDPRTTWIKVGYGDEKRLPKGWICLKYNGDENVYKFIGNKIQLTSSLAYSPKYLN